MWVERRFVASIDRDLTRDTVIARAKAKPGSYIHRLAERVADSFFGSLKDLEKEYHDFYAREYDSLARFLFWRYSVSESSIDSLLAVHSEARMIVHGDFSSGGDGMIDQLSFSDESATLWMNLLNIDIASAENDHEEEDWDED